MTRDRETNAEAAAASVPEPAIRAVESTGESFDPALQRELDRGEFAGEEAIEGKIVKTGEWDPGVPIELTVWVPIPVGDGPETVGADHFIEALAVPAPDESLSASKFGRVLAAHGYSRSQASHLVDEPVECSYTNDGWEIADPSPSPDQQTDATESAASTAQWNPPSDIPTQEPIDRSEAHSTATGVIVGTKPWDGGDLALTVRVPNNEVDEAGNLWDFTQSFPVPAPDASLSSSRFGRLLAEHGYTRQEAHQLVGETVRCVRLDGTWMLADPSPPAEDASHHQSSPDTVDPASESSSEEPSERSSLSPSQARQRDRHKREGASAVGGSIIMSLFAISVIEFGPLAGLPGMDLLLALVLLPLLLSFVVGAGHLMYADYAFADGS